MILLSESVKDIKRFIDIKPNDHYGLSNCVMEANGANTNGRNQIEMCFVAYTQRNGCDFFET